MLYAIVALVVILIDQWVKFYTAGFIHFDNAGAPVIPGILSLVNVHNPGAAFSLFSGGNARIYFIIITGVFTLAVIIALATKFVSGPVARWSLVLMTAGGLSNCIDRVIYGYVQDMFKFEPLPSFPVFNVADIVITVFCFLFILALFFEKDRKSKDDYDDAFSEEEDAEEEEEDEPVRKPLSRRAAKRARVEEDEEDDEEVEPVRKPQPKPVRRTQTDPARDSLAAAEKPQFSMDFSALDDVPTSRHGSAPARPARTAQPAAAKPQAEVPAPRAAQSVAPARPQAQPASRPAAKPASKDEFSLDDILAEFRDN